MVGVRKIVLNRLEIPEAVTEEGNKPSRLFQDLLKEYHTVTICGYGSKEHAKAGLLKENVLIKASGKRVKENKEEVSPKVTVVQVNPVTEVTLSEDKRRLQVE